MVAKILVVEDEEALLNAIEMKMQKMNVDVSTARSVLEAEKNLKNEIPDLIWLDHYLYGEKSGLELLKDIKKCKETKDIPVVVVTNTCTNDKYNDYMELGIHKFYEKSSARLDSIINDALACVKAN